MKFNSKTKYNHKANAGGSNYNSAPFFITIYESSKNNNCLIDISTSIKTTDTLNGADAIFLTTNVSEIKDMLSGSEIVSLQNSITADEQYTFDDIASILSNVIVSQDSASLSEFLSLAKAFFVVSDNMLYPLEVYVLGDSRKELLPQTRDISEEVSGRHGEIDFGSEFKARNLELHVVSKHKNSALEKSELQRLFAKYLNPTKGAKTLIFADDIEKTYTVKYSGKIDISEYATWFDFTIPFKMSDPFITGSFEQLFTGSGVITCNGNTETPFVVEITGPVTNPSLSVNGETLSYTGTIGAGQKLIIDTEHTTVKIDSTNAMVNYNGVFPVLQPGLNTVVGASNITIKWHDKWI